MLRDEDEFQAKIAKLSCKLESFEVQKVNEVNVVPKVDELCSICDTIDYSTRDCLTIPAFKEVLHEQVNAFNQLKQSFSTYPNTDNFG